MDFSQRCSYADRDDAVKALSEHHGAGRIDFSEFDERSTAALSAKTYADLRALFLDLPDPRPSWLERLLPAEIPAPAPAVREEAPAPAKQVRPKWVSAAQTLVWPDFALVPGAEAVAVGSRSQDRADAFASKHGLARAHGSYEALIADDEVDAIYIATPHPQHVDIALNAIAAGKHLLVEKSFTATVADTERIIGAARSKGVFAMEAMWTRFIPAVVRARELVDSGAIGELRMVQGTHWFFGTPDVIHAHGNRFANGVDASASITLGWADGRSAALSCSLECPGPGRFALLGTKGWIDLPPRFHHPKQLILHLQGEEPEVIDCPITGGGYYGEILEATQAIAAGRTESQIMPLDATLAIQKVMAEVLDRIS